MIFYFTGTGNSLQVAKNIAWHNNEQLISIAKEMNSVDGKFQYTLREGEIIGFVFPVYAWAPPKMVLNFIEKLKFDNYKNNYIFSVATCGENIGNTMKVLDNLLKKNDMQLKSGFSLKMPNNYIIMGDIDSKKVQAEKLSAAEEALRNINRIIKERKEGVFLVNKGLFPGILTSVINPLFNKNAINTRKFTVSDKCNSCGLCEKVCNSNTIRVNKKPQWKNKCTQCLACIHICPVKAIQYGKGTEKKGRYINPNIGDKLFTTY
ncbi:NAD(P)H-quinone oxidoreductase subunit I, chloroplastic [Clostridium homopropionicum DSM 5847]|uniref:NAD(P)H-quinone oxidoreductase subunit I, chloroplastic n=1 Tax=Clostridium homopropionicum DSM 5847 TaxID=1121318 RepID=A0A0L6Z8E7_9CLOT|nr:EFR1 family ferrodoxin [Clostridium homopropionicum]KOA19242.1 NAD(P)H-quinone oxidoreductase subunit I, chloroplastic [Clostridium homopropionicum DSM 5847]SFG18548.1 4Fe-4S dicluster domain-containing protein [Clostridium homopropionicum]